MTKTYLYRFMKFMTAPAIRLKAVRAVAVVPLVVGGLLAVGGDVAQAQCYFCDDDVCEYQEEGSFGFSVCWMGEIEGHGTCMAGTDSEVCDGGDGEGGWALSPMEEALENKAVLAMVRSGRMLPADSRYFTAPRGDVHVVRNKCGGSLVGIVAVLTEPLRGAERAVRFGDMGLGRRHSRGQSAAGESSLGVR